MHSQAKFLGPLLELLLFFGIVSLQLTRGFVSSRQLSVRQTSAIVRTEFNHDQYYGGVHCGVKQKKLEPSGLAQNYAADDDDDELDQERWSERIFSGNKLDHNSDINFVTLIRIKLNGIQEQFCSGVLITDRHMLTAAHCVSKCNQNSANFVPANFVTASMGQVYERWDVDLKTKIKTITVHDKFNPCRPNYEYDIAMLTAIEPVPMSNATNRVCLPPYEFNPLGPGTALGFGFTSKDDRLPWRRLNSIEVNMNDDLNCLKFVPPIDADMICATGYRLNFCPGDSGGPLVVKSNNYWTLLGINSITHYSTTDGINCTGANYRSKFVKVNKVIRWIGEMMEF